uniref:Sema domain-containing protein n=1 Tax=Caenorhabditis japonica TaxID=281687 RepID=A0A8R1IUN7_CAEJA
MRDRHEMHNNFAFLILIFALLTPLSSSATLKSNSNNVYSIDDNLVFENPSNNGQEVFEKMAIDPSTTRVFVGAVNSLYDLTSADLTVRRHVQTGPADDSPLCRGQFSFFFVAINMPRGVVTLFLLFSSAPNQQLFFPRNSPGNRSFLQIFPAGSSLDA